VPVYVLNKNNKIYMDVYVHMDVDLVEVEEDMEGRHGRGT
jgi:hypothetical protein